MTNKLTLHTIHSISLIQIFANSVKPKTARTVKILEGVNVMLANSDIFWTAHILARNAISQITRAYLAWTILFAHSAKMGTSWEHTNITIPMLNTQSACHVQQQMAATNATAISATLANQASFYLKIRINKIPATLVTRHWLAAPFAIIR